MECQYALVTFGIPKTYIPFDESGNIELWKIHAHMNKIQKMEKEAELAEEKTKKIIPTVSDVLLGRGKPFQSFPGKFHHFVVRVLVGRLRLRDLTC